MLGLSFFGDGEIEGMPTQVGVYAISLELSDGEMPAAHAEGLVLLTISATTGFSFTTVTLPSAQANSPYQTPFATNAPSTDTVTFQVLDTSLLPTDLAKKTLPPGLVLYSDGLIQGSARERELPVPGRSLDSLGGVATQAFSITVVNNYVPSSGCQSAPGGLRPCWAAHAGAGGDPAPAKQTPDAAWPRIEGDEHDTPHVSDWLDFGALRDGGAACSGRAGPGSIAPCGEAPTPIASKVPFQDITTQLGYQPLAAPTTDTMSDYTGGNGEDVRRGQLRSVQPGSVGHPSAGSDRFAPLSVRLQRHLLRRWGAEPPFSGQRLGQWHPDLRSLGELQPLRRSAAGRSARLQYE